MCVRQSDVLSTCLTLVDLRVFHEFGWGISVTYDPSGVQKGPKPKLVCLMGHGGEQRGFHTEPGTSDWGWVQQPVDNQKHGRRLAGWILMG